LPFDSILCQQQKTTKSAVWIDLGFSWKTAGYLPVEIVMDRHFGRRLDTSTAFDI